MTTDAPPRAVVIGPGAPARADAPRRSLRAVVVGPGARRALREGAGGVVELAFGPGGYVRLAEHRVLLAPARSPLGPLSILVAGLARGDLVPGEAARVSTGALLVGALRIGLDGAADPPPPARRELAPRWREALAAALDAVPAAPPDLEALAAGDLPAAVAQLAGRGEGLTPAGDDALAGYAAWRWAQGDPVALPAHRCSPLGRDYLRCAERGELAQPAARVLDAIRAGEPSLAARRARTLADWGATSGAAILWGMAAGAAQTRAPRVTGDGGGRGPDRGPANLCGPQPPGPSPAPPANLWGPSRPGPDSGPREPTETPARHPDSASTNPRGPQSARPTQTSRDRARFD